MKQEIDLAAMAQQNALLTHTTRRNEIYGPPSPNQNQMQVMDGHAHLNWSDEMPAATLRYERV